MTNDQKENLFVLIKSLSKSEKRQFKLYVGRIESNLNSKFLILFTLLDKMEVYDEKIYKSVHLGGKKADYMWRLEPPERGAKAGIRRTNIGPLFD